MCLPKAKKAPAPPPPPAQPPKPTPPAASAANLPKADAYNTSKKRREDSTPVRSTLQIPLTSSKAGSGVNTGR